MDFIYYFLGILFNSVWDMFSISWPGFKFSIGYVFLGVGFAVVALRIMGRLFSLNIGLVGAASSLKNKPKISDARKKDEK